MVSELYGGAPWQGPTDGGVATLCKEDDNRIPLDDPRVGRLLPGKETDPEVKGEPWCTAFIIDWPPGANDKVHLTAGHCFDQDPDPPYREWKYNLPDPYVLEMCVPDSNVDCPITHPPVSCQFPVNRNFVISENAGVGNDWAVFRCHRNKLTGLSTFQHSLLFQGGGAFPIGDPAAKPLDPLRITGCGIDGPKPVASGDFAICQCNPVPAGAGPDAEREKNGTRQTATGPGGLVDLGKSVIWADIDTCNCNSGSPIIANSALDGLGGVAMGILTAGWCKGDVVEENPLPPDYRSYGIRIDDDDLRKAIVDVGLPIPTVSHWGLAVITLLFLTAATVVIMRRRLPVRS